MSSKDKIGFWEAFRKESQVVPKKEPVGGRQEGSVMLEVLGKEAQFYGEESLSLLTGLQQKKRDQQVK